MAKQEKSAGGIVYYMENNEPIFLFLQNTLKKTYWEVPKGKIEINEPIKETVKREVNEETSLKNLKIIPGFEHNLQWYFKFEGQLIRKEAVYLLVKIPRDDKDKVVISDEHQKFSWMNFEQAMKNLNIKSNKEMIKSAHTFIKEFEKQKTL